MLISSPLIDDAQWPPELLQIKNKFAEKYDAEIADIKKKHEEEIAELKENHLRNLNGALDRARRRSLKDDEKNSGENEADVLKERDRLRRSMLALRNLLRELLKYFTECEDELNNTLIDELTKNYEANLSDSITDISKRVHFTPNFNDFLNIVDNTSLTSFDSADLSVDFKTELDSCLDRLKADANAVLALTSNLNIRPQKDENNGADLKPLEEKVTSLTRQLKSEIQVKNNLNEELIDLRDYTKNLEAERLSMEQEVEQLLAKQKVLENDLCKAKEKISDLIECGHKEIVSEGYGENQSITEKTLSMIYQLYFRNHLMIFNSR